MILISSPKNPNPPPPREITKERPPALRIAVAQGSRYDKQIIEILHSRFNSCKQLIQEGVILSPIVTMYTFPQKSKVKCHLLDRV